MIKLISNFSLQSFNWSQQGFRKVNKSIILFTMLCMLLLIHTDNIVYVLQRKKKKVYIKSHTNNLKKYNTKHNILLDAVDEIQWIERKNTTILK